MPLKTIKDDEPTLNLTPMIDVLFLLIIYFMAATQFADPEQQIQLDIPQVAESGALTSAPEPRIVNVQHDGQILLGTRPVNTDELTRLLAVARGEYPAVGVLIRGDENARHGRMSEVYSACRRAGISDLAISVKTGSIQK